MVHQAQFLITSENYLLRMPKEDSSENPIRVQYQIGPKTTHVRHDPAHCLAPGLFRSLRRGARICCGLIDVDTKVMRFILKS